ncbi:MAG: thymidine phosphorylase [Ignavibacteria bacterium]|nr:thymidine phosphorylase [Ignavibacteria bacterium]
MNPVELIIKKRNGINLSEKEIEFFINGFLSGEIPDYQMSAFLMSIYFRGMTSEETVALTKIMLYSGEVLDLSLIHGKKVDKHSTGGVGDKTSLVIAPIASAAGVVVPMISGRGLGHTGGTLDKLESIPGFRTNLSKEEFLNVIEKIGVCLIGQTKEIAPADKKIYALRDVTGTVESIPLICASIMSKKLAEGINGLVLDVKTGNGAFMKTLEDSENLAKNLKDIAEAFGVKTIAYITNMNQPLGNFVGNWLEVYESVKILKNEVHNELTELCHILAGTMIYLGEKAPSVDEGIRLSKKLIENGKAYQKFLEIVESQSGDISYIENLEKYPEPKFKLEVKATRRGFLNKINSFEIGMLGIELGAGRMKYTDTIDPKAGFIFYKKIGNEIKSGDIIAEIRTDKENHEYFINKFLNAIEITDDKPLDEPLIFKTI